MMVERFWVRGECGSIAPLAVVVCLVLVTTLGFAVDHGVVYAAKAHQEQALDAARQACMDASGAVPAKYADNPGLTLADGIVQTVRDQGVSAALTVWFYEAPAQSTPRSERLWVIGVQVEQHTPLPFSVPASPQALTVASSRAFVAKPYSAEAAWRPERRICGSYRFAEGSTAGMSTFSSISSLQGFPDEMVKLAQGVG